MIPGGLFLATPTVVLSGWRRYIDIARDEKTSTGNMSEERQRERERERERERDNMSIGSDKHSKSNQRNLTCTSGTSLVLNTL